jgi:hypothetical protein
MRFATMEKANDGSFPRISRKSDDDEEDDRKWDMGHLPKRTQIPGLSSDLAESPQSSRYAPGVITQRRNVA